MLGESDDVDDVVCFILFRMDVSWMTDQATAHVQRVSQRGTDWMFSAQPMQARVPSKEKKSNIPLQTLFVGKHPITSAGIKKCHTLRLQYLHLSIPTTKKNGWGEESMGEDSKPFWVPSSTQPKRRKMRGGRSRSSIASAFDLQLRCWGEEKHVPRYAAVRVHIYYTFHVCMYIYIFIYSFIYACKEEIHLEHFVKFSNWISWSFLPCRWYKDCIKLYILIYMSMSLHLHVL